MTIRRRLVDLLQVQPRSVSSLARELGIDRGEMEEHLRHAIRSARASGFAVVVIPAKCRTCGFEFSEEKLSKPGKCPSCGGTRLYEPQIRI
jgi:predicted Zn-ribbon and HTH transcriptional regulator